MSESNERLEGAAYPAECRLTPDRWGAHSAAQRFKSIGSAAGRTVRGDEKSEAIMGAWEMVAAGSGLNAMLGVMSTFKFSQGGITSIAWVPRFHWLCDNQRYDRIGDICYKGVVVKIYL
jgi:hypothetical protein